MFAILTGCKNGEHKYFTSGTHLVVVFLLFLLGRPLQKSLRLRRFKRIGMKFGRVVLQVNTIDESDFWYDVTLSRWRPWRSPAVRCCVRPHSVGGSLAYRAGCATYSSWSTVHSYLFFWT